MTLISLYIDKIVNSDLIGLCTQISRLSPAESEVVHAVAKGYSVKRVAFEKKLSVKTISCQKRNACKKLGVKTDVELIHYLYMLKISKMKS